ncbi:MAG: hypothetical protein AAF485_21665 [Chloroflexota bacterium]
MSNPKFAQANINQQGVPAIFDFWDTTPIDDTDIDIESLSFSASADETATPKIWRLKLPDTPDAASTYLRQAETQLQTTNKRLEAIPNQLDNVVTQTQSSSDGDLSFSTNIASTSLSPIDTDMVSLLHDVNRQAGGDSDDVPDVAVNFGITDQFADWRDASQQLKNMLARPTNHRASNQLLLHFCFDPGRMSNHLL